MSYNADQLIILSSNLEQLAAEFLDKNAEKKEITPLDRQRHEHDEWTKKNPRMRDWSDKDWSKYLDKDKKDTNKADDKKKLDPKAKVRNRGTVCVPAESAKDKKDHFPINNEAQARNALARVHQYDKVPSWYSGSLKSLQELVSRKVHSKYKGIGKDKKKSSALEVDSSLLNKYAQEAVPPVEEIVEPVKEEPFQIKREDLISDLKEALKALISGQKMDPEMALIMHKLREKLHKK